jgi:hypothetical protein
MKPEAIYVFEQTPEHRTRYKLIEHRGADIPDFPAQWKRGPGAGGYYIGFRETVQNRAGHRQFTHTLELGAERVISKDGKPKAKTKTCTGLNFTPEFPRRAFGDYGNDALLIDFSENWDRLTILFFKGQKAAAQSLFEKWTAGEMPETPAAALPLETKKPGITPAK